MLLTRERIRPKPMAMPDWPAPMIEHIQRRLAVRPRLRLEPGGAGMRDLGEIGANGRFKLCQRVAHAASQPPSTTITVPVVNEDASLARCSAV